MFLKEFKDPSTHSFKKLNSFLKKEYGIQINEKASADELIQLIENANANMHAQKRGNFKTHQSKDYNKFFLIKEAATVLLHKVEAAPATQYEQIVNVFVSHVLESVVAGKDVYAAFDDVVTISESLSIPYDNFDIYADVKDVILENTHDHKLKEPVKNSVWDLLPVDKRVRAHEIIQNFKKQGSDTSNWELQDYEDPRKGFLNTPRRVTHDMVAQRKADQAAKLLKPDSVLARAGLEPIKENTVKNLSVLLENEIEEAEVVAAARNFGSQLQSMVEKIGRLQNEDLGPVVDQMRLSFGNDTAQQFFNSVNGELQTILDNLRSAKDNIEVLVGEVATGQPVSNDMDSFDVNVDTDQGDLDLGVDLPADEFGGDPAASGALDEPLGRAKKESIENLRQAINEATVRLAQLKAAKRK